MESKLRQSSRYGFTLVEMLVVITIISILASLVLFGASRAQKYVRQNTILTEIDNLSGSFQEYKNKNGDYPPNTIIHSGAQGNTILADLKRHFKKAFPKHQEPDELFIKLASVPAPGSSPKYSGMNASEAVVFWLGGFSEDARYPVSGKGGPSFGADGEDLSARNFLHTFDQSRLGPRNEQGAFIGRSVTYTGPAGSRQINLWTYTPSVSNQPYAYFDTSRYKPSEYDPISAGIVALKTPATGGTQVQFVNPDSFQILHSGLDNAWGDFSKFTMKEITAGNGIAYPNGPFTGDLADNLVSFSRSTLEASEP